MTRRKIAFFGLNGGVGRTTLVAHVAQAWSRESRVPMAFDFDPQNTLGLYLGMSPGEWMGISHVSVDRAAVADLLRRNEATVPFLPFGSTTEQALRAFEYQVMRDSSWLTGRVDQLAPRPCDAILIDTPATPSPWLRCALKLADFVVIVVRPDAACYASLPRTRAFLQDLLGPEADERSVYVVNRFDGSRTLDRDVVAAYHKTLGARLLPVVIEECASVAEALASGTTVAARPSSVVPQQISQLGETLFDLIKDVPIREERGKRSNPTSSLNVRRLSPVAGEDAEPWSEAEGRGRYSVYR